jgi:hypothetical protein
MGNPGDSHWRQRNGFARAESRSFRFSSSVASPSCVANDPAKQSQIREGWDAWAADVGCSVAPRRGGLCEQSQIGAGGDCGFWIADCGLAGGTCHANKANSRRATRRKWPAAKRLAASLRAGGPRALPACETAAPNKANFQDGQVCETKPILTPRQWRAQPALQEANRAKQSQF